MASSIEALEALRKDISDRKLRAELDVAECVAALNGLEVAFKLLNKNGQVRTKVTVSRSGERSVPDPLRESVLHYIGTIGHKFTSRDLRQWLQGDPNDYSESETGDVLNTLLRQLEGEAKIKVVVRGVGRRLAEYEPA